MEQETATPEAAPVESPPVLDDALAKFLAEDDTPQEAKPDDDGEPSAEEPVAEGEAQEADEATPPETPPVDDQKFKVKVRGEELEVPLSELLNGYSRTEDYKAKTAEVAEQRRQLATEYADKLESQVQNFIALDPVLSVTANLDWAALAQQDPNAYVQLKAQHDQRVEAITQAQAQIDQIRQQQQAQQAEAVQEFHTREREALLKARPELADQANLSAFAQGVVGFLQEQGFSPEQIRDTNDHRALLIADAARQWFDLQKAKTTAAQKQTPPKPQPTLKPRATEQTPRAPKRPAPNASDAEKQAWVLAQLDAE